MKTWYRALSKNKKIVFLSTSIPLSIPAGGVIGFILGLMSITFVPTCPTATGFQSCAVFHGMIGYEATSTIGFWIGLVLFPLSYIALLFYFEYKNKKAPYSGV
ncbi:MAG: hypothetical protein CO030_04965 [Candidatus Magasanikbacteria bacterium CG_4_9_14_0_2_um_filter_42_11]|uniref:DUF2062 domain-containing protein n=1 Tax=Candidatus Magasanikbacteria bacterium CG_4_9_14_0_2_um_filter_42_11 TaxID=1974643 RepID=A0A2M8F8I6_9BACT|nr:MAG: hypothetical protein COU34_04630 [Candidatus Magasanikbacteria bacterium CG10_big_fil_rev_8_21_14_0_10_43_9]PIY92956.1 MAG: hypothetical protein COY70_00555 [Candidatus Magasanikbacteria bacterium CG_4_10_14_0_8_um_filter_42_12]PJC52043.1 MAG: hypothetical protein CO030_04965 [Candidatus Magasanikbacteria bacterium CG_4_9_14_0_2_um_filter_42_11]